MKSAADDATAKRAGDHHHRGQHHKSSTGKKATSNDHSSSGDAKTDEQINEDKEMAAKVHESTRSEPHSFEALLERKQQQASKQKPTGSFESLLERKQQAASPSTAASAADAEAAALDRRINAKRAANRVHLESTLRDAETPTRSAGEVDHARDILSESVIDLHNRVTVDEFQRVSSDRFHEQGSDNLETHRDTEAYYPNAETDSNIMAEIAQEGLVDEAGGIQAFVADTVVPEADVVGVIPSDEEVERKERIEYIRFFLKAVVCIVFLIIVIGVPVTLKYFDVIGPVEVVTPSPTMLPSYMPSESPSSMPSSVGFTEVVNRLYSISGEALMNVGSPQHRAARWISDEDPMQLAINDPGFEQRYVMAVFYYSLNGEDWSSSDGWLSGNSECTWEGVGGPGCMEGCIDGKVCAMRFACYLNNMKGTLPDEISLLIDMRYFDLQNCEKDLTGTIPSGIGTDWINLKAFLVNNNDLTGAFPFMNNPLLGTILMNRNDIEGDIGSIAYLPSLSWFEAEDNKFTGTLPDSIPEMRHLEDLKLTNNNIIGNIPDTWANASLIKELFLSGNKLTGNLPSSIAEAPNIEKLHLSRNLLSGSLPLSYYQMQNLKELYIDSNTLGGSLSQMDEPLYFGIQKFAIYNNTFEGRFPVEQFEKTEMLNVLSLHDNKLTGMITYSICQRLNESNPSARLTQLSVDCDLIECTCCACY